MKGDRIDNPFSQKVIYRNIYYRCVANVSHAASSNVATHIQHVLRESIAARLWIPIRNRVLFHRREARRNHAR